MEEIKKQIEESRETKKILLEEAPKIKKVVNAVINCFKNGNKLLIFGNGGSAADAQHFAAEFIGRFKLESKALPAIALTTDSSILTAWSNDYSYDTIFERQVQGLAKKGDILIGLSTSGNSKNIVYAFSEGKKQ